MPCWTDRPVNVCARIAISGIACTYVLPAGWLSSTTRRAGMRAQSDVLLCKLMGEGTYGCVHLASAPDGGPPFAVKIVKPDGSDDDEECMANGTEGELHVPCRAADTAGHRCDGALRCPPPRAMQGPCGGCAAPAGAPPRCPGAPAAPGARARARACTRRSRPPRKRRRLAPVDGASAPSSSRLKRAPPAASGAQPASQTPARARARESSNRRSLEQWEQQPGTATRAASHQHKAYKHCTGRL